MTSALCLLSPAAAQETDPRSLAALKAEGVVKCAQAMSRITRFLHDDDEFAYLNTWHKGKANEHMATTMTAKTYPDGEVLGFLAASPSSGGTCDTAFVQVFFFAESCTKVREAAFRDWRHYHDLGRSSLYKDPSSDHVVVSFTALPGGCLGMKRGVAFFPTPSQRDTSP